MHSTSFLSRMRTSMLLMLVTLLAWPAVAGAVERTQGTPYPNPTGLLTISPGRVEVDVEPGVRQVIEVSLTADSEEGIDVSLEPTDIGAASDPRSVAARVENGEFGAGDWLTPEVTDLRLEPFETVTFDLVVDPPADAPVGTNLAGLVIDSTVAGGKVGTADSDSAFRVQGLLQVFLTVPGPVDHDLRISDIDVRDQVVLGGQRFAVWDVTFTNSGTVNEHVNGKARVKSLFGNTVHTVNIRDMLVLRGGTRTTRVVWRDLPWVGIFRLDVRVRGDDARAVQETSDPIIVMPWWLPLVIVATIFGPILYLWWRRRREWRLYLEDEGEGEFDDDVEWDDDGALIR